MVSPYRWLKLASDAPTGGLTVNGEPTSPVVVDVVNNPLLVGATIFTGLLQGIGGYVYAGDTFTIAGDPTVYTIASRQEASSDWVSALFTPPIAMEAAAGTEITFDQVGPRAELADRDFYVVTKG